MKVGDLINWAQGLDESLGLVLDIRPTKGNSTITQAMNPTGLAVLAMFPELNNNPEWFHEYELELISESR